MDILRKVKEAKRKNDLDKAKTRERLNGIASVYGEDRTYCSNRAKELIEAKRILDSTNMRREERTALEKEIAEELEYLSGPYQLVRLYQKAETEIKPKYTKAFKLALTTATPMQMRKLEASGWKVAERQQLTWIDPRTEKAREIALRLDRQRFR